MKCCAVQHNQKPDRGTSGESSDCTATLSGLIGDRTMKRIPLTQGQYAIVDDDKYDWLMQWKWSVQTRKNTFYAARGVKLNEKWRPQKMHRLLLGLKYCDGIIVDHINRNGLDNRMFNLRICTQSQNLQNQFSRKGSSRYKGVNWVKKRKEWQSRIWLIDKNITIGIFNSEIEAAKAYDKKARELRGEFAYTNF